MIFASPRTKNDSSVACMAFLEIAEFEEHFYD
jgi:hypothetical protein